MEDVEIQTSAGIVEDDPVREGIALAEGRSTPQSGHGEEAGRPLEPVLSRDDPELYLAGTETPVQSNDPRDPVGSVTASLVQSPYTEEVEKWLAEEGFGPEVRALGNNMFGPGSPEAEKLEALIAHIPQAQLHIAALAQRDLSTEGVELLNGSQRKCRLKSRSSRPASPRIPALVGQKIREFRISLTRYIAIYTVLTKDDMWKAVAMRRWGTTPLYTCSHRCNLQNPNTCIELEHVRFEPDILNSIRARHHAGLEECKCQERCLGPNVVIGRPAARQQATASAAIRQEQNLENPSTSAPTVDLPPDPSAPAARRYHCECGRHYKSQKGLGEHRNGRSGFCSVRMRR